MNIVFLWWWGAGLSALANVFQDIGFENIIVLDKNQSEITDKLETKWIKVKLGEWKYNFEEKDIVIYSDAVINSQDFKNAKKLQKFTYFEFVGEISKYYKTISIAWTHWKTTTTSMLLHTYKQLKSDDFALGIVGGFVKDLDNKNYLINPKKKEKIKTVFNKILYPKWNHKVEMKEDYFIIEACEFNEHFLLLDSYYSLILKTDWDHKDFYPTQESYDKAFDWFKEKTSYKVIEQTKCPEYDIKFKYVFGKHNIQNASILIELLKNIWYNEKKIIKILGDFQWAWRRQEYLGKINNTTIYTDYAHHPEEIRVVQKAFKENFPDKKIIWVFQPHQIFRFLSYENLFVEMLTRFNKIFIYDIYSVREKGILEEYSGKSGDSRNLKWEIWEKIALKCWWKYIKNLETLVENLEKEEEKWVVVIMTAGDLDYKIRNYLNNLVKSKK